MKDWQKKDESALKTIGEVANEMKLPTHVLRFWETKFKQLNPQKRRGIRYYAQTDITLIAYIQDLLYTKKYTLEGVKELLKDKNNLKNLPSNIVPIIEVSDSPVDNVILDYDILREHYHGLCVMKNKILAVLES